MKLIFETHENCVCFILFYHRRKCFVWYILQDILCQYKSNYEDVWLMTETHENYVYFILF